MATLATQISNAKSSGKLVISGRSLSNFPDSVCSALLPRHSPFHPANQPKSGTSSSSSKTTTTAVPNMDGENAGSKWFEERPLSALLANANEFTQLPQALGGFEELATLDLKSNLLTVPALPHSLMSLVSLTSLNLANNKLDSVPLQLLALDALITLDLSGNHITQLWQATSWRDQLEELQKECREAAQREELGRDPDDTFSTESDLSTDFWSTFPSSPAPKHRDSDQSHQPDHSSPSDTPFPRLKTLNLSNNRLTHDSLLHTALPSSLAHLDLSRNPLGSSRLLSLEQTPFESVDQLQTLNLSNCELEAVTPASFPRMRELDLSGNTLDTLNDLPLRLSQDRQRTVKMTGLPRALESMNKEFGAASLNNSSSSTDQNVVVLRLSGNALGSDIVKWRSRKRGVGLTGSKDTPTSSRVLRSQTRAATASTSTPTPTSRNREDDEDEEDLTQQVGELNLGQPSTKAGSPSSPSAAETFHFAAGYNAKTMSLQLSNQKMSEFPGPSGTTESPPVAVLDLGRNQIEAVPFATLAEYRWTATLTRLDMSRNRLSRLQDAAACSFDKLETLNLACNMLSDPSLLQKIAALCPALAHLDLSTNFLSELEGVQDLLLRPQDRGGGLKTLRLGGNRLSDLTQLVEVAQRLHHGAQGWRCTTLELVWCCPF